MGYYTDYTITSTPKKMIGEIKNLIESVSDYDFDYSDYSLSLNCKWYDCEEDMLVVSESFPEVLIEVTGEGEESGDLWKAYFQNGKYQKCVAKLVYPEYNPDLMAEKL